MITLDEDRPKFKVIMFTQSTLVAPNTQIWHKHIGHVNQQRLKKLNNQNIVTILPKIKVDGMQSVCEGC